MSLPPPTWLGYIFIYPLVTTHRLVYLWGLRAKLISEALKRSTGAEAGSVNWLTLGCPEWLAVRAERLGFNFPTGGRHLTRRSWQ